MKKLLCIALIFVLSLAYYTAASAVTIKTASTFAGADPAAEVYIQMIAEWEQLTGHKVEDFSSTSDETWKADILNDFAAGNEADVLFYFANTSDSRRILSRVVPLDEINAAYPDARLPQTEALREPDGKVYAVPVRSFWEGLFVNKDLFEQYDIALPTSWDAFVAAIEGFRAVGITPISASLSDVPHYLIEFTILMSGTPEEHQKRPRTIEELPESWVKGNELIRALYEMNAFADDVNATTDAVMEKSFIEKRAAMRVDGSWYANSIPKENFDSTIVLPFPAYSPDADPTAAIVGVSMGFYISRKAWNDPQIRDAAVSFLLYFTSESATERLGFLYGGELLASSRSMIETAGVLCSPLGDGMDNAVRREWYAQIPKIADGSLDARAVMESAIRAGAFAQEQ